MQIGNYAVAFCIWQPLAQQGDTSAQFNLGWMYHNGYGLRIDDDMAFYWWLKAATKGDGNAHFALGDLYASGQGVDKSHDIAIGWYISAAMENHEQARETLTGLLKNKPEKTRDIFRILLKTDWKLLGKGMQVRVAKANTRHGPDKSHQVVKTLNKGHIVIPISEENGWTLIGITGSGEKAWIFSKLLQPVSNDPISE